VQKVREEAPIVEGEMYKCDVERFYLKRNEE
jgi:hypothetical protein